MRRNEILLGLLAALSVAVLISPFASSLPDGLEWVAERLGFIEKSEVAPVISSPIPDYAFPGIKNEKLATSFAGAIGTTLVFAAGYGVAKLISMKRQ